MWDNSMNEKHDQPGLDITIVLDMMKGSHHEPHEGFPAPIEVGGPPCGEPDWKQLAQQLLQVISMMDTHTDAAKSGQESERGAIDAIDSETSRVLWSQQIPGDSQTEYTPANYSDKIAAGLMLENPADLWYSGEDTPKKSGFQNALDNAMGGRHEEESDDVDSPEQSGNARTGGFKRRDDSEQGSDDRKKQRL